ncbi:hypothetical protein NX059_006222 [Plenodomus lindquistii]|nr:hypothetical protein NX059_006222 [Plenodomus lindquistii]
MLLRFGIQVFLTSAVIRFSSAAECNPLAVSLPFKSNVLSNRVGVRGIQWDIGGPSAQTISLLPSASFNDTYLYGAADNLCQQPVPNSNPTKYRNFSAEECTTFRGGLYSTELSESEATGLSGKKPFDNVGAAWTTDDVTITDDTDETIKLSQLSFGIRTGSSHPYVNQGELGLGVGSTLLSTLASEKNIASKTYSFYWGIDSTISDSPRNGSLTLGGYDAALIGDSPNTTTTFTRNNGKCREGMIVELTGIDLHSVTGTTQRVLESERLEACVVPTLSSILMLPYQYWDKIHDMLGIEQTPLNNGSSGELFYGVASVKPSTAIFKGNLSISLNNELTVDIPDELFIFDEPYTARNGQIRRNPDWKNIPVATYLDLDSNMPRLGGMFLSSAYLMVNHDKDEFTIAPVQSPPVAQNLMGIDTGNGCVAAVKSGALSVPDPSATKPSNTKAKSTSVLSAGVIAGIVVGVLLFICLLVGIMVFLWRRWKSHHTKPEEVFTALHVDATRAEKDGVSTMEMWASSYAGELNGDERYHAIELDGSSQPMEVAAYGPTGASR